MNQRKRLSLIAMLLVVSVLAACGPTVANPTPAPTSSVDSLSIITPAPVASATPAGLSPIATATATTASATTAPATPTTPTDKEHGSLTPEVQKTYEAVVKDPDMVVLMGKFVKYLRDDNALRDPKDISKPNTSYLVGVKVYLFRIESVLKGGSVKQKEVEVALEYCEQNLKSKSPSVPNTNFMEPNFEDTVILPLFFDPDLKWYTNDQGIEPQRFVLKSDDMVEFQSLNADTKETWKSIKPITLKEFKAVCSK